MKTMRMGLFFVALSALVPAFTTTAAAQPESRPMFFSFGLGPSVGIGDTRGGTLFKLEEAFGVHVLRAGDHPGLYIAGVATQGFRSNFARLSFGVRAGFDIQLWSNGNMQLLISPLLTMGAAIYAFPGTPFDARGAFNMGFGGDVRLVLADGRFTVWARPLGFEIDARNGSSTFYDFLFGAALNF